MAEGMRIAMINYLNQAWLNKILQPLAPSLNPNFVHAMRDEWHMPPHFNPIQPQHLPQNLPFFSPDILTVMNPIFLPGTPPNRIRNR